MPRLPYLRYSGLASSVRVVSSVKVAILSAVGKLVWLWVLFAVGKLVKVAGASSSLASLLQEPLCNALKLHINVTFLDEAESVCLSVYTISRSALNAEIIPVLS
ncbi:uncharacterized protein G2W53_033104 [Senna tora]|uniref:Uncharacterized protein n=1 Tax=Senna tora TaxID=362788 RepID=A0A834SYN3_9FABA|nr:uncharacterized protein G2W53_033104 [Senna tora]